ncbi:metal ABC transporter solute-binding protein, Zn/Mn family [Nesterenkonia sp. K-15-9-6]|uniref:metal ABC transporter solute-binding protein, Zn/Mn family n=1 Tax=Nesterenkonia sp. K-15-9-6 TaxID=3093918 RepID=UPI004045076E
MTLSRSADSAPAVTVAGRASGLTRVGTLRAAGLLTAVTLTLTACGGGGETADDVSSSDGEDTGLVIIASTDVYSDLAEKVVGDTAEVDAMVDNPAMDPHSYEATPQDRLSIEKADVIIANGGGYDPFITRLASSAGKDDLVYQVIDGENHHAHEWTGSYENEHVWYDLSLMAEVVRDFGEHMSDLAPENADLYGENAESTAQQLEELDERNRALGADGLGFLATEPVSQFLLLDAGFDDLTEEQFLAAVEHGDDVAPRIYQDALDTATGDDIDMLAYNEQTETNQSLQIRQAAEDAGVPVVEFSETLPDDIDDYLEWMEHNIDQVEEIVEAAGE